MSGVRLSDPAVIQGFRRHLADFMQLASNAISPSAHQLNRTRDWLRGEQLPYWKKHSIQREEDFQQARRAWLHAEAEVRDAMHSRGPGKPSSIEERVVMDRARRHRDQAEEKLTLVRRWMMRLDQEAEPIVQACQAHEFDLRDRCGRAVTHLDHLVERVQSYLDVASAPRRSDAAAEAGRADPAPGPVPADAGATPISSGGAPP